MKHSDLIKRLGEGSGRDDALEAEIVAFFNNAIMKRYPPNENVSGSRFQFWSKDGAHYLGNEGNKKFKIHGWLHSLDACISLLREVLPGWDWEKFKGNHIILVGPTNEAGRFRAYDYATGAVDSLARALLIAILKAVGGEE